MGSRSRTTQPPSPFLLMLEGRSFYEVAAGYLAMPILRQLPKGDGHTVMVIPGLGTNDIWTRPLRNFLQKQGYDAQPWQLGTNLGPSREIADRLVARVKELYRASGRKISLVGWSLGGIYARELARALPRYVRQVVTLGSPFGDNPKANRPWRLLEWLTGVKIDEIDPVQLRRLSEPPPVPTTSIYSRSDGVAAWQCCRERKGSLAENVEVEGSHTGLLHNPLALYTIADRLAQPEGRWRRFRRDGFKQLCFPDPRRDQRRAA